MTFIVETDYRYIKGQTDYDIKKLSVIEKGKTNIDYIYVLESIEVKEQIASTKQNYKK